MQREQLQILPGPTLAEQPLFPCLPEASTPAFLPEHWGGWHFSSHVAGGMCLLGDGSACTDYWNLHNLNFK